MGTIIITAKKDGFRRCGVAHSKQPTEYPADHFSAKQLKQLQAEPMLTVQLGEAETKPPKAETKPPKAETKPLKAEELVAAIDAAETLEQLAALVPETETRKTVVAAYQKRLDELQPKE